ncbi:hypothetical protein ACFLUE_02175 [Chloroflexota bacterium]
MKRLLVRLMRNEKGQALPIVLIMLVLSGLIVAPIVQYIGTSFTSGRNIERDISELYAANAGIEDTLWKLNYDPPDSEELPYSSELQDVNGLSVDILVEEVTTLYGFTVGSSGVHADYLDVEGELTYDEYLGVSIYTASVENLMPGTVHFEQMMIKLPPEYEYIMGSADGDFSSDDPQIQLNPDVGQVLFWELGTPRPEVSGAPDIAAETVHLNGPIDPEGARGYVWVRAAETDIGSVGEGGAYKITAQAKDGETVVLTLEVGVVDDFISGELLISNWEIDPPSAGW